MSLVLNDVRTPMLGFGRLFGRRKTAAPPPRELVGGLGAAPPWLRLAGGAALGFAAGAAALGGRKVIMQATTGVAGDWFAALKADHKLVNSLFHLLLETGDHE